MSNENKLSGLCKAGWLTISFGTAVMAVMGIVSAQDINRFEADHPEGSSYKKKIASFQGLSDTEISTLKIYNLEKEEILRRGYAAVSVGIMLGLAGFGCVVADGRRKKSQPISEV